MHPSGFFFQDAGDQVERLRAELHKFAALAPRASLDKVGATLQVFLQNPELEAFLRRSGGLKMELAGIQAMLMSPGASW